MIIADYTNGNAHIQLDSEGTRVITYDGDLKLEYPLNIDIRVSTKCSFGQRPDGTYVLCNFCHESAKTDGSDCDYQLLREKLVGLPKGIELAIGSNDLRAPGFDSFLWFCFVEGYVANVTINQGHIKRDFDVLRFLVNEKVIKGVGISYRESLKFDVPKEILDYSNTVFHVIAGIDSYESVEALADKGVKKLLILGEKNFGFNTGNVDLTTRKHKEWFWWVGKLFDKFEVVSFDNLALEQLKIKRFFTKEGWETSYQGEHSFYINAVEGYFAPSSRSGNKTDWNSLSIKDYFSTLFGK